MIVLKRLGALLLAIAPIAAASEPASTTDITVTGLREAQIRATANTFVSETLSTAPRGGQYARWNVPICVEVKGVDQRATDYVAAKFRSIATDAGVKVARDGCTPNILVRFVEDAPAVADKILLARGGLAMKIRALDREALRDTKLPVRWMSDWRVEDENGVPALVPQQIGSGEDPDATAIAGWRNSLITVNRRVSLERATVLVDVNRSTGYSLQTVAAHAAMAVLARAELRNNTSPDVSILGTFQRPPGAGPSDLTVWDKALLKSLYRLPANRDQARHRNMLVAAIAEDRLADGNSSPRRR